VIRKARTHGGQIGVNTTGALTVT